MQIGKRVKKLRKTKRMTLKELSAKSGVQIATLSRLENEKMVGTLESHLAIAKALNIDLPSLYKDIQPGGRGQDIIEQTPATDTFTYNDRASFEILAKNLLSKKMMPIVLKIEAGGKTSPEQNPAGTEKFIFVLSGQVTARVGENSYTLKENNTLYFDASLTHYYENSGAGGAKIISVATPVVL